MQKPNEDYEDFTEEAENILETVMQRTRYNYAVRDALAKRLLLVAQVAVAEHLEYERHVLVQATKAAARAKEKKLRIVK